MILVSLAVLGTAGDWQNRSQYGGKFAGCLQDAAN
jgi:hypothetical protein